MSDRGPYVSQRELDKFEKRNSEDHNRLEKKVDDLSNEVKDNFKWLLGAIVGLGAFLGVLMTIYKFLN